MSSLGNVLNSVGVPVWMYAVCAAALAPRGYTRTGWGFRLAAHTPIQTPLTTHRHGNQGAQERDAGWWAGQRGYKNLCMKQEEEVWCLGAFLVFLLQ